MENSASALKVGTDAVLLGAVASLDWEPRRVLDAGTGTGVIALMLAQRLAEMSEQGTGRREDEGQEERRREGQEERSNGFHIDAIDIDGPSAEEAKRNFAASPWAEHLAAHHAGLAEWGRGPYDLIISNPPYFENSLRNPDARESAARHADTLSYRELCACAVAGPRTDSAEQPAARPQLAHADRLPEGHHLAPGGRLAVILPAEQETDLRRTAASFGLYPARIVRIRTTDRKAPKRIVVELAREKVPMREEQLTIQKDGDFTPEYRSYVHPFLLYL